MYVLLRNKNIRKEGREGERERGERKQPTTHILFLHFCVSFY
jgi:hypothetical protein